jgi:hypothetical protein
VRWYEKDVSVPNLARCWEASTERH